MIKKVYPLKVAQKIFNSVKVNDILVLENIQQIDCVGNDIVTSSTVLCIYNFIDVPPSHVGDHIVAMEKLGYTTECIDKVELYYGIVVPGVKFKKIETNFSEMCLQKTNKIV